METIYCPHAGGVICREQERCGVCGWNPEVTEARRERRHNAPAKQDKKSRPSGANTGSGNLRKA